MKILIYDVSNTEHGVAYPLSLEFNKIGLECEIFDWTKYLMSNITNGIVPTKTNKLFNIISEYLVNINLLNIITHTKFDVLLVLRGDFITPSTINRVKNNGVIIINWNTDDIFNVLNSNSNIINSFRLYDAHLTSRYNLIDEYIQKGNKSIEKIDWYYREDVASNTINEINNEKFINISFVGSWSKRRERLLNNINSPINIYGWGWMNKTHNNFRKRNICHDHITMRNMIEVFKSSKINVNILTIENRDISNIRNFEIPCVGGFQICERSEYLETLYKEDEEIVFFETGEELADKINFYLNNDNLREQIAKNGYLRLKESNYSIKDRAFEILNIIKKLKEAKKYEVN